MNHCGSCQVCCSVLKVTEIDKAPATGCKYQCKSGCSIYKSRPGSCKTFNCMWLSGNWPIELRPDKSKFMFIAYPELIKCYAELEASELQILDVSYKISKQINKNIKVTRYARI